MAGIPLVGSSLCCASAAEAAFLLKHTPTVCQPSARLSGACVPSHFNRHAVSVITAGCEADAVAFEEEQRRDFQEPSGTEVEPLGRFTQCGGYSLTLDEPCLSSAMRGTQDWRPLAVGDAAADAILAAAKQVSAPLLWQSQHHDTEAVGCTAGCEEDAVAFQEESSRSLRSDEQHATEPKTVLPDGSYSTGPRALAGLTAARFEHCLVRSLGWLPCCPVAAL